MELLFLTGAVQAFFFGALLWGDANHVLHRRILIVFFLLNGVLLLNRFLELEGIVFEYPHLLGITYTLPLVIGPTLYFYTLCLTDKKKLAEPFSLVLHLVPFFSLTGYFLFDFYFLPAQEKLAYYYHQTGTSTSIPVFITEISMNASLPVYCGLSLVCLKGHMQGMIQATQPRASLRWLFLVLCLFSVVSALVLLTNIFTDVVPAFSHVLGDNVMYGSVVLVIYVLGFYGVKNKVISVDKTFEKTDYKPPKAVLPPLKDDPALARLLAIMEAEKLYLNSKLSLNDLATRMDLSENKLSQLINDGIGKNFYEFVNDYRVRDVLAVLKSKQREHLTLLGIALECGFNSKSSFNNIFKQKTGMTPSDYKRRIR